MGFPFFLRLLAHIGLALTSAQGYVGSEQCWLWMWDIYGKDVCVELPRPDPLWEISSFDTFTLKLLGLPFPISGNSLVVSAAARSYILEFLDPAFLYSSHKLPPQKEFALTVYKQHISAARRCTINIMNKSVSTSTEVLLAHLEVQSIPNVGRQWRRRQGRRRWSRGEAPSQRTWPCSQTYCRHRWRRTTTIRNFKRIKKELFAILWLYSM